MPVPLFIALAVVMAPAPAAPGDAAAKKKDASEKLVCKTERFVGSNISSRICKTRAEWDLGRTQAKEVLDQRQGQGTMTGPAIPGG